MAGRIQDLLEELKAGERARRLGAVNALGKMAQEGQDIGAAEKELEGLLSDEDAVFRIRASWALAAYYLKGGDVEGVKRLLGNDGIPPSGIIQALAYSVRKGTDISALIPDLERLLEKTEDPFLRGSVADVMVHHHILAGSQKESAVLLRHKDGQVRSMAAGAYREAAYSGADITDSLQALRDALLDDDGSVKRAAAEALTLFHSHRKQWDEISALLRHRDSEVRGAVVQSLYGSNLDIGSDIDILKLLEDEDYDVREGAVSLLRRAAEEGKDIAFAVPALKALGSNPRFKEAVDLTLRNFELRKDKGDRCQSCLDCELGIGAGMESGNLEELGAIEKEIPCCAGVVTHTIYRCNRCRKHYISSYWDHTGFHGEQFTIDMIGEDEAEEALDEIRKCKDPHDPKCGCKVHSGYLKGEQLPVKGVRKYSETVD